MTNLRQLDLFETPVATSEAGPATLDALLAALGQHDWNRVGSPRVKGGATFHTFRYAGTDDERELAEGELPYWLDDLDRAAGTWAKRARTDIGALDSCITRTGFSNRVRSGQENLRRITDVVLRETVRQELVRAERAADERITALEQRAAAKSQRSAPAAQQAELPTAWPQHAHTKAEVRAAQSAGETLRAAGWRRRPGDALGLTWAIGDPEQPGELYEVEFFDLAEVEQAAALLRAEPGLTPAALLERMGATMEEQAHGDT